MRPPSSGLIGVEPPRSIVTARAEGLRLTALHVLTQMLVHDVSRRQRRSRRRALGFAGDDFALTVEQRERGVVGLAAVVIAAREPVQPDEQRDRALNDAVLVDQRHRRDDAPGAEPATDDQIADDEAIAAHHRDEPLPVGDVHASAGRARRAGEIAFGIDHRRARVLIQSADGSLQGAPAGRAFAVTNVGLRGQAGENLARRRDHVDLFGRGQLRGLGEVLLQDAHAAVVAGDRLQDARARPAPAWQCRR